jgi:hypothetical protein
MSSFGQNDFDGVDEKTTPLMAQIAEDGASDDPLAAMSGGHSGRSGVGGGMLVLLGVVVVAGGTLLMMRKYGQGPGVSIADVKIDYPLGQTPGADGDHKRVLDDLKTIDSTVQIPLGDVRQNPFEMVGEAPPPEETVRAGETEADRLRREAEAKRARVQAAFEKLQLATVLSGSTPVARISGQTVRVGDTVGELFTVVAIHDRSVDLRAGGQIYTLTMGVR